MTLRDSTPLIYLRDLVYERDAARVCEWAQVNWPGWVHVGSAALGCDPAALGWASCDGLGLAWRLRAYCQKRGVGIRFVVGWRADVVSSIATEFVGRDPGLRPEFIARSPGFPWREALARWEAAGYTVEWPFGFDAQDLMPGDAALYASSPACSAARKHLALGGLCAAQWRDDFRAWAVEHARATLVAWGADAIELGVKPWLRAGQEFWDDPAAPDFRNGGLLQPTPYKTAGRWEGSTALMLRALAEAGITVITQTRPPTPPLADYYGMHVAHEAAIGEAVLTLGFS